MCLGARYAEVVARNGASQVSATSQFVATTGPLLDFAMSTAIGAETGAVTIEGNVASGSVSVASFAGFAADVVNYDIIGGVTSQSINNSLDGRNLTTENVGNLGLLKPARDADRNILRGN